LTEWAGQTGIIPPFAKNPFGYNILFIVLSFRGRTGRVIP
jgi:hypothetical protein